MFDNGQILNYAFLLKNLEFLDVESVPLAEVSTSRHDTYMLGEMFQLLKFNYNKIFKEKQILSWFYKVGSAYGSKDPDPDPHQNTMDLQLWLQTTKSLK